VIRHLAFGALLLAGGSIAQQQPRPPAPASDEAETRLHRDWAWLARYAADDRAVGPTPGHPRVVFLGDSITQGWFDIDREFFTTGRIGRGIGGQTTPQMLVRFRQDVIDLHPDVVQIMAGTNDIAGNTGPMTDADTEGNVRSMVELAQANGIRVIIASIPPADQFPWRPGLETGEHIRRLNTWLRSYATKSGSTYADYWTALKGSGLGARAGLTKDHVHPTPMGYHVMDPVAEASIREALARPAPVPIASARS
jgi:lysophospholipase L1-like esterase